MAPSVWRRFKDHRWDALEAVEHPQDFEPEVENLLRDVMAMYGEHSATALENLTHQEEPWIGARGNIPPEARSYAIIPQPVMQRFYRRMYAELEQA